MVLLGGEAGIGKSRILAALRERLAEIPHARLRCQCSPYFMTSALHPFIRQLERAAGLAPEDPPTARMAALERHLAACGPVARQAAPLFARLLAIPGIGRRLAERVIFELKEKVAAAGVAAAGGGGGEAGEGEIVAALQALGYSLAEARGASRAAIAESALDASLEERVKAALRSLLRE